MKVAFFHVNVVFNVPNSLARHASSKMQHANNHYWGLRPFTYIPKGSFHKLRKHFGVGRRSKNAYFCLLRVH